MNIAILSDKIIVSGGAERYLCNIIRAFLRADDQVDCYTTKITPDMDFLSHPRFTTHRLNLFWCPRKLRHIWFDLYLKRKLRQKHYDLVIGVSTPYSPGLAICCGTYLGDMRTRKRRMLNPLNWVRVYYERKKYRGAKMILVRSRIQKRELISLYDIPPRRIAILPPPTASVFSIPKVEEKEHLRVKHGLDKDKYYFLLVSNNHHRKGLTFVINALEMLKQNHNCRIVVVGAGQGAFPDTPYVRWLGYQDDVSGVYRACDALVLHSSYEPFGQVVTEALFSGLPVLVSDRVGAADIINDPRMGAITPWGNVSALAQAIEEFATRRRAVPKEIIADLRDTMSIEKHIAALKQYANARNTY